MTPHRFIILTHGRAGSTYLQQLLNSHPSIDCRDELFNVANKSEDSFYSFSKRKYPLLSYLFLRERINNSELNLPLAFLFRQYMKHISKSKKAVVGFRLVYDQFLYYRPLRVWITNESLPIIHLQRHNLLKSAMSLLIARNTGEYVRSAYHENANRKIKIDPAQILNTVELLNQQKLQCEMMTSRNPALKLYYEDLFGNQNVAMSQIVEFLAVPDNGFTTPDIVKSNPEKISDMLENYAEVKQALTGTRWEKFLD